MTADKPSPKAMFSRYLIAGLSAFGVGGGTVALTQRNATDALDGVKCLTPRVASVESAVGANTPRIDRVVLVQDNNVSRITNLEAVVGVLKQQNDEQTKALDELKRDVRETNANVLELLRRTPK